MSLEFRILEILREKDEILSGEKLARELDVSRVAIWKAIKRLQEKGYSIRVSRKGYTLENKDIILPEDLEKIISRSSLFRTAHYYYEIPSTMDLAKEIAESGISGLILAEKQKSGRGRLGRYWDSQQGGLWLTLALIIPLPLKETFILSYLSSLAVVRALNKSYNIHATLKWPNDILLSGKKLGGILLELKAEVDLLSYALIGIGINVNNKVSEKNFEIPAISISEFLGTNVKRLPLLANLIEQFENLFRSRNTIIEEWKKHSDTLGKMVRINTLEETIEGIAYDIDRDGALLVRTKNNVIKRIFSGDCFHLR